MATLILQEPTLFWRDARLTTLNKRTLPLLQEMDQVPGAQHAFVCDKRGNRLAAWVSGELPRETFDRVGACVATISTTFPGRTFSEMEFQFVEHQVYVRTLGNAFIVIVCTRGTKSAILRMTLNVATTPFLADKDLQRFLASSVQ